MAARVITLTSGKGGVGKTTATANIGVSLAQLGRRVVVLDADIGLRNLDVVMGLENRVVHNLVHVVRGVTEANRALIRDKRVPGLMLLAADQHSDKDDLNEEDMREVCEALRAHVDFVLVDSPAGIEQGFRNAMAPADELILVTTPEVSAVRDADRVIGLAEAAGKPTPRLLINRIKPHTDFHGRYESGLAKMAVIGLGKVRQASIMHGFGVRGLRDLVPLVIPNDTNPAIVTGYRGAEAVCGRAGHGKRIRFPGVSLILSPKKPDGPCFFVIVLVGHVYGILMKRYGRGCVVALASCYLPGDTPR